ncbi:MAG: diversity-generating retroelement protein bAvd family protein [Flavobacteriales bacterium]|mgnify:CR=1 FL=1|nr:diversity-generating retroelement protein bAvd family protein [Flavobacteriales bacterium]|tara:strand:+ start:690 stop:1052 length:363 start_codon:yes stop_codon:yes gene_type:complete
MEKRHNYKKLTIWKVGIEIADDVYDLLEKMPNSELYGMQSQMSRSSSSIPTNIAEGSSRSNKSFSHFLDISLGSSYELETQLIISERRKYIKASDCSDLKLKIDKIQKMIKGFKSNLGSV